MPIAMRDETCAKATIIERFNTLRLDVAWNGHFDYGRGGWYQGSSVLGFEGLRDSDWRIEAYDLRTILLGARALDLGCHTGFLWTPLDEVVAGVVGIDHNPKLTAIAQLTAEHLDLQRCAFETADIFDVPAEQISQHDAIVLFSSHISFESFDSERLNVLLANIAEGSSKGDILLFESHPPDFECRGPGLEAVIKRVGRAFREKLHLSTQGGHALDHGREYFVFERA